MSCNQEVATPEPNPIKFEINTGNNMKDDTVLLKIKERIKEKDSLRKLKNKRHYQPYTFFSTLDAK